MGDDVEIGRLGAIPGSSMCWVCGKDSPRGMHLDFYSEGTKVWTEFVALAEHQGYQDILHGGVLSSVFDDVYAYTLYRQGIISITGRLEVRFRRPVPIGSKVTVSGEAVGRRRKRLRTKGEAFLDDGSLVAEANAIFVEVAAHRMTEGR